MPVPDVLFYLPLRGRERQMYWTHACPYCGRKDGAWGKPPDEIVCPGCGMRWLNTDGYYQTASGEVMGAEEDVKQEVAPESYHCPTCHHFRDCLPHTTLECHLNRKADKRRRRLERKREKSGGWPYQEKGLYPEKPKTKPRSPMTGVSSE